MYNLSRSEWWFTYDLTQVFRLNHRSIWYNGLSHWIVIQNNSCQWVLTQLVEPTSLILILKFELTLFDVNSKLICELTRPLPTLFDLQVNQFVDGLAGKLMLEPKYCELAHNKRRIGQCFGPHLGPNPSSGSRFLLICWFYVLFGCLIFSITKI